jgi:uncharacterized membrane protein
MYLSYSLLTAAFPSFISSFLPKKLSAPIAGLLLLKYCAHMKVGLGPIVLNSLSFKFSVLHLYLYSVFLEWPSSDMTWKISGM